MGKYAAIYAADYAVATPLGSSWGVSTLGMATVSTFPPRRTSTVVERSSRIVHGPW